MSTTVLSCMMQNTSFSHRPRNATLCIESARSYDEGVYVCVAANTLGQSRNTSVLRVAGNFYTNSTCDAMHISNLLAEWLSPSSQ